MVSARQLRAARADLMLTLDDVSEATGVSKGVISDIEKEKATKPKAATLDLLRILYESKGIEFLPNGGIAPRSMRVDQYTGAEGFKSFMNDVYEVARSVGGEIRLHNAKPLNWKKWMGEEFLEMHLARMEAVVDNYNFKITAGHGDKILIANHAEYRWLPKEMWNEQSFYAYGDRLALLNFEPEFVHVAVVYNRQIADSFRSLFDIAWETTAKKPEL